MSDNALTTQNTQLRVDSMSQKELTELAEKKSAEILIQINESTIRIKESKEFAENAKNMKTHIFGIGTKKKLNATSEAVVRTNEAMMEMNNLIQESIKFTCSSIALAQIMHKTMAYMMVNGFKDSNGNIQQLTEESKEAVETIIDEQEQFIQNQLEIEQKQNSLENQLNKLQNLINAQKRDILWKIINTILSVAAIAIAICAILAK